MSIDPGRYTSLFDVDDYTVPPAIAAESLAPRPLKRQHGPKLSDPNPCIALYGKGPDGQRCKGCVHLRQTPETAANYWKCDLRECTRGPKTDHRVNWPACGRYEVK